MRAVAELPRQAKGTEGDGEVSEWINRRDSALPYQEWRAFEPYEIVQVANAYGDKRIGQAKDFWWGYEQDMGEISEGTIVKARCLSKPLTMENER